MKSIFRVNTLSVLSAVLVSFAPFARAEESVKTVAAASAAMTDLSCAERIEMGTPFKICLFAKVEDKLNVPYDMDRAFKKIREMNSWMSDWLPETQVSQINQAAGVKPVKVGAELFDLLKYVLQVSEKTGGAFDPTFNAFFGLYNFKPGQEREPTDAEIKERLPLINYKNVVLDEENKTVFLKRSGMKIGLGAVGQSYAVDHVIEDLKKRYPAGYVDGSGDTAFWGVKPDGAKWTTAIRDPRDKSKVILRIYGTDFAITTSGDDEKFFMKDGRRVHHIIDPKTGRPATRARQVTVISKRALDADAYDTAAVVMGPKDGMKVIESLGFQAVIVTDKEVSISKGLKKRRTSWGEAYEVESELK